MNPDQSSGIEAPSISARLNAVRARIDSACRSAGRDARDVQLLAVSKRHSLDAIRQARAAGQLAFGESYADEGAEKIDALTEAAIEWHFIGPIQSNKTAAIAQHFAVVHSVDRAKIVRRLNDQRHPDQAPLGVYVQVHLGDEVTKHGVAPADAAELVEQVRHAPRLDWRGLMCIPPASDDYATQRKWFDQLRDLGDSLGSPGLSMGMSGDLEAAIAAGATIVRVGTDIFGPRP